MFNVLENGDLDNNIKVKSKFGSISQEDPRDLGVFGLHPWLGCCLRLRRGRSEMSRREQCSKHTFESAPR